MMRQPALKFSSRVRSKRPEAQLQRAIVQHLILTGVPGLIFFSIPNEGKRSEAMGAELKRMGMRPGIADLCIIIAGRAHFLEVKARDGKQSPEQAAFEVNCFDAGVPYALANSIDASLSTLRRWGAIRSSDKNVARAA